ncbi:MAG: ComF family protein [Planctomycetota bacterium]
MPGMLLAAARHLATALFPALCPGCTNAPGPDLCPVCQARLPRLRHPCPRCATPRWHQDQPCPACARARHGRIARVHAPFAYVGLIRDLVRTAKGADDNAAIRCLARLLVATADLAPAGTPTSVVCIPPAPGRRSGPHLATALARSLAADRSLPLRPVLACRHLPAEQHRLPLPRRRHNVAGLYRCRQGLSGDLLLVDDLLTSGATLAAAADALRAAGAGRITACCLARTPEAGEPPALIGDQEGDTHSQTAIACNGEAPLGI